MYGSEEEDSEEEDVLDVSAVSIRRFLFSDSDGVDNDKQTYGNDTSRT